MSPFYLHLHVADSVYHKGLSICSLDKDPHQVLVWDQWLLRLNNTVLQKVIPGPAQNE